MSKLSKLLGSYENLSTPPSSQATSSPLKIALSSPPVAVLLTIGAYWLIEMALPIGDSTEQLKAMIAATFLGGGIIGTAGGIYGLISRSLKITDGKIANLTPRAVPETVNVGSAQNVNTEPRESTPQQLTPSAEYSEPVALPEYSGALEDNEPLPLDAEDVRL